MTVCRNPHYWEEGKPYIDCVRLRQYQGNDQVQAALIRGEVDWGSNFIPDIEKNLCGQGSGTPSFLVSCGFSGGNSSEHYSKTL